MDMEQLSKDILIPRDTYPKDQLTLNAATSCAVSHMPSLASLQRQISAGSRRTTATRSCAVFGCRGGNSSRKSTCINNSSSSHIDRHLPVLSRRRYMDKMRNTRYTTRSCMTENTKMRSNCMRWIQPHLLLAALLVVTTCPASSRSLSASSIHALAFCPLPFSTLRLLATTLAYSAAGTNPADTSTGSDNSLSESLSLSSPRLVPHVGSNGRKTAVYRFTDPIQSTQDEARRILLQRSHSNSGSNGGKDNQDANDVWAVVADVQLAGRGTRGRTWERGHGSNKNLHDASVDGNVYVTIVVPMSVIPVTLTLVPLQVAVFVAQHVSSILWQYSSGSSRARGNDDDVASCPDANHDDQCNAADGPAAASTSSTATPPKAIVKWPNDVLIHDDKVSGTLIESETVDNASYLLIGIGINVLSAPRTFSASGNHRHGRKAGCLQDYLPPDVILPSDKAFTLSADLAHAVADWVTTERHASDDNYAYQQMTQSNRDDGVIRQWKQLAVLGQAYTLRNDNSDDRDEETVTTLDIERDGQLRVRGADGRERLLMADYLV